MFLLSRLRILATVLLCMVLLSTVVWVGTRPSPTKPKNTTYFVNLGDSYAEGYQPGGTPDNMVTHHGYADQLVTLLRARHHRFTLANFGCGGATTHSLFHKPGCTNRAAGGVEYPHTTQAKAVFRFLREHRGHVGLVVITLGANDFGNCFRAAPNCVPSAMGPMTSRLRTLTSKIRSLVGPGVPMIASSYPDVRLGLWTHGALGRVAARLSIQQFRELFIPALENAYRTSNVTFIDVARATGAFIPLTRKVVLEPYGSIPVAVAQVCHLTWACSIGDGHPTTPGYAVIAELIESRYLELVAL